MLCVVPIGKAYSRRAAKVVVHAAIVLLLPVAACRGHQMRKVTHKGMMFSSSDIFFLMMCQKIKIKNC